MVKEANSIASDEASERVSSDTELRDSVPFLPEFVESSLDFVRNSLAANLSAIVGETAGIALGHENVEVRVALLNAGREILQVFGIAP